jgi:hypothetical protein
MSANEFAEFAKFLALPEDNRLEILCSHMGVKLHLWQRIYIRHINKWWTYMRETNPHLRAVTLWESIYKGRF